MFSGLEGSLNGKKIALFGSYGWGDGQWMRDWCERAKEDGAQLFSDEGLICNETPTTTFRLPAASWAPIWPTGKK